MSIPLQRQEVSVVTRPVHLVDFLFASSRKLSQGLRILTHMLPACAVAEH